MNKSLLEILEEEKRALRNVENFKYSKDGILEMAKSETEESNIQSCFRIVKEYEKKLEKEEEKLLSIRKEIKEYFSFLENL